MNPQPFNNGKVKGFVEHERAINGELHVFVTFETYEKYWGTKFLIIPWIKKRTVEHKIKGRRVGSNIVWFKNHRNAVYFNDFLTDEFDVVEFEMMLEYMFIEIEEQLIQDEGYSSPQTVFTNEVDEIFDEDDVEVTFHTSLNDHASDGEMYAYANREADEFEQHEEELIRSVVNETNEEIGVDPAMTVQEEEDLISAVVEETSREIREAVYTPPPPPPEPVYSAPEPEPRRQPEPSFSAPEPSPEPASFDSGSDDD